ncbi:MAG: hypothetical protein C0485_07335 [Pirellula sp.]|nr:hypothetical protein [Pirellula sp.]
MDQGSVIIRIALFACFAFTIGCGGADALVPVSGTVKNADGAPLVFESGTIIFQPTAAGRAANGAVDKSGAFEMTTATPGDGVQPGTYKVVLQLWKNYRDQVLAVPKTYGDVSTTPLEVTVDVDHDHFDLSIEK